MGKDLKIIYISHLRYPSEKTHSYFAMKTCESFAKKGFIVELWKAYRQNKLKENPFSFHNIEQIFSLRTIPALDLFKILPGKVAFFLLVFSLNVSLFLALVFKKKGKFIIYTHDLRLIILPLILSYPTFLEVHDFYQSRFRFVNRWCFARVRGFIVTNSIKAHFLARDFGVEEKKILIQPNAVDLQMFWPKTDKRRACRKLNLPQDKKIVVYTGHLFAWKGVDVLLEAGRHLSADFLICFVGGTDEDIERFRRKAAESESRASVKVVGRRAHKEIPLWLAAADILVLPNTAKSDASRYETSPVKLFEYMSAGKPIIASDLPSIREIANDRFVFFFKPDDPHSLAATIIKAIQDAKLAQRKADLARQESLKYSWEKRGENIIKFIQQLML